MTEGSAYQSLEQNKHIKELTEILKANGLDAYAQGLTEVAKCVSSMERELTKAINELTAMHKELSSIKAIKEGQDRLGRIREQFGVSRTTSAVRNMLEKAADSLMKRFKSLLGKIKAIKQKIIGGCKQAVEDIKDEGIVAASGVVDALNVRGDLEATRDAINSNITHCEKQVAKIETASTELHTAGMHLRNFGRTIIGREPVHNIKPNGKLATLLQTPFRNEIKFQKRALARNDRALERLGNLEKAAALVAEKNRPSAIDEIKRHKEAAAQVVPQGIPQVVPQVIPDAPKPIKVKVANQEI